MTIINQEKDAIANYNNMQGIRVKGNEIIGLFVTGIEDDVILLGRYKTKERAKKVLQEIIKFYETSKRHECSSNNGGISLFLEKTFIYEMPEE